MSKVNPISKEKFTDALNQGKKCYLKKPRSWQKIWFWWEIDKEDPEERWFMNVSREERKKDPFENSSWITAKDLGGWLDMYERKGYQYYIHE